MSKHCRADLTTRQAEVLDTMAAFLLERQRVPTCREIADMLGAASSHAGFDLCNTLIRKGFLAKDGPRYRILRGADCLPFALTRAPIGGEE